MADRGGLAPQRGHATAVATSLGTTRRHRRYARWREEKADAVKKVIALTADVTALAATVQQLGRIIHVLVLENRELRLNRTQSGKVVPLATGGLP